MKISIVDRKKFKNTAQVHVLLSEDATDGISIIADGVQTMKLKLSGKERGNLRQAVLLARRIVFFSRKYAFKKIALDWNLIKELDFGEENAVAEIFATNFEMANYEFVRFKTAPKQGWNFVEEISVVADNGKKLENAFRKGQVIGRQINECRELANIPGGEMTPKLLVERTKKAIVGTEITMKVLDAKAMQKLGMNSVLAVAKGSAEKPQFIILEYKGVKSKKPVVLIGKGVTFDSGGLNIKPGDSMNDMNMDMSGGAAVIHTLVAAAKLRLKRHVIGLIPAVENMPSGESLRPGDIIKSMSGQTIEILNTDAEGRVILADAHTFAERYAPDLVVDVATLTGAASVALGERASALLTKDRQLSDLICRTGEESGDYVWPLPLWDEYEEEIKGVNGDICNTRNRASSRDGGTILGAMFVYQFAKKFPRWAHLDIAPRMTAAPDEFLSRGAAGAPVRLLINLLEKI